MIVYIILAFLVFVLNYLKQVYWFVKPALTNKSVDNIKNGINEGKESSFTAIFILVLISGFRAYSVGLDLGNYLANFNAIANNLTIKTGHGFEILFQSLNYWCALIFGNQVGFTVLLFIISIIFAYSINQVIQKNSASFALSFFLIITLGIYAQSFSALRQILALSVVLLSIKYIQQRNLFMFIFYIIIAIFFHKTAFIFFPVFFL
ncbi:MAG: EpsG family protein, partial [Clostridia bacterium]